MNLGQPSAFAHQRAGRAALRLRPSPPVSSTLVPCALRMTQWRRTSCTLGTGRETPASRCSFCDSNCSCVLQMQTRSAVLGVVTTSKLEGASFCHSASLCCSFCGSSRSTMLRLQKRRHVKGVWWMDAFQLGIPRRCLVLVLDATHMLQAAHMLVHAQDSHLFNADCSSSCRSDLSTAQASG